MKKKYYFVILFLVLAIFFLINTSNVNATMYKIVDIEGNIVRITDQPTLSIEEKEAGYTISPPPDEQEIKQEILNKSNKYDFRETNWGMSKKQVKEIEKNILLIGEDIIQDSIIGCDGSLHYKGEVNGLKCDIYYYFMKDRLISATYKKVGSTKIKEEYIKNYENLKGYLIKKYGRLYDKGIEMIKNEPTDPGAMLFWENPTNNIYEISLFLLTFEDKAQIQWLINYQSEEGKNIRENFVDYTEKINAKKEAKVQIEARIKELKNKPKAEIRFIDSTNYLSGSGNYYYVEGILKNNGKGNAYSVKVEVQALDKYDKLVSTDNVYADPSTLAPGQEATYQMMVRYNSNIDKFDKKVSWSVESQTEVPIKEKDKINIVDWNNRLSASGNYIYVEGSLKNIGNQTAEMVRVIVKSLDSNGKLVSIDDGYTNLRLISQNKEAIFQIMLKNNYKIKKLSLVVLTESNVLPEVKGVKEKLLTNQIININTASLEELMYVLEISEHTAMRIIDRRKEMNGFKNPKNITFLFEIGTIQWEEWIKRGVVIKV
jgi:DNA uptake protein ComE-like DNA-binding protein